MEGQRFITLMDKHRRGKLLETEVQELFSAIARLRTGLALADAYNRKLKEELISVKSQLVQERPE